MKLIWWTWKHKNFDPFSYKTSYKYPENSNSLNVFILDSEGLTVQHNWQVYFCVLLN